MYDLDYQIPATHLKGPKGNGDNKGTKGKLRYAGSQTRLKCAT